MATATETKLVHRCDDCGISANDAVIAGRDGRMICGDCDDEAERRWVAEDPENNSHYLDTFSPGGW